MTVYLVWWCDKSEPPTLVKAFTNRESALRWAVQESKAWAPGLPWVPPINDQGYKARVDFHPKHEGREWLIVAEMEVEA